MSSWTAKFEAFHLLLKLKRNIKTDSAGLTVVYDDHFLLGCESAASASFDKASAHNSEDDLQKYKGYICLTAQLISSFYWNYCKRKKKNCWRFCANAKVTGNNCGILECAFLIEINKQKPGGYGDVMERQYCLKQIGFLVLSVCVCERGLWWRSGLYCVTVSFGL